MNKRSNRLRPFYVDLQKWIDAGCPDDSDVFSTNVGICANLDNWQSRHKSIEFDLSDSLYSSFRDAGLSQNYPFCNPDDYWTENHWTNKKRLAWVKEHAQ